jgi:hypothetical protein
MAVLTNEDLESKAYTKKEAEKIFVDKKTFIEELQEASQRALNDERKLQQEIDRSISEDTKFDENFVDLWGDYDPQKEYDKEENFPSDESLLATLFNNYNLPIPPEEAIFEDIHPDGATKKFILPEDFDYECAMLVFKNGILLKIDEVEDEHDYALLINLETGRASISFNEILDTDDKVQVSYIKKATQIAHRQVKIYQFFPASGIKTYAMPSDTDYTYTIKVFMNGVFLDDDVDYLISQGQTVISFHIDLDDEDEIVIHYLSTVDVVH